MTRKQCHATNKTPSESTTNQEHDSFAVVPGPARVDTAGITAKAPLGAELSPTGDADPWWRSR